MALIWFGGEDIDFPNSATPQVTTTGGNFRSGYARCGIGVSSDTVILKGTAFTPSTSLWLSARIQVGNFSSAQKRMIGLGAVAAGNRGLFLGFDAVTNGRFGIWKYDGTTETLLASESGTTGAGGGFMRVDMQVANFGSSGTINLYVNGTIVIAFSGTVTISGLTNFDCVIVGGNMVIATGMWYSEIIVADEDTRAMSLVTMAPNAAGTTDNWTGTVPGNINEITLDDATTVYTNVAGRDEQANLIDLPSGAFGVRAVRIAARAMHTGGSVPTKVALGVNHSGTIDAGTPQAVGTGFATIERIMATNPVTGSAWQQSDMNALQLNLRSSS